MSTVPPNTSAQEGSSRRKSTPNPPPRISPRTNLGVSDGALSTLDEAKTRQGIRMSQANTKAKPRLYNCPPSRGTRRSLDLARPRAQDGFEVVPCYGGPARQPTDATKGQTPRSDGSTASEVPVLRRKRYNVDVCSTVVRSGLERLRRTSLGGRETPAETLSHLGAGGSSDKTRSPDWEKTPSYTTTALGSSRSSWVTVSSSDANTTPEPETESAGDNESKARPKTVVDDTTQPRENIVDIITRKQEQWHRAFEQERERQEREREERARKEAAAAEASNPVPEQADPKASAGSSATKPVMSRRGRGYNYAKARVLTVHWAAAGTLQEPPAAVRELRAVLRRIYGYSVTSLALPTDPSAEGMLAGALAELANAPFEDDEDWDPAPAESSSTPDDEGNKPKTLVVLHYGGPSKTSATGFKICPPTWPFRTPLASIDLQSLMRETLLREDLGSDALVLLDCPYACDSFGNPMEGKEVLAASTEPTGFSPNTPARDLDFTWRVAHHLQCATSSVHFSTAYLESVLVSEARRRKNRRAELDEEAGLKIGCGPPARYIRLAPVTTPWQYWRRVSRVVEAPGLLMARCGLCKALNWVNSLVHRCTCGYVRGHTWEQGDGVLVPGDVEMDEMVTTSWLGGASYLPVRRRRDIDSSSSPKSLTW